MIFSEIKKLKINQIHQVNFNKMKLKTNQQSKIYYK